MGAEHGKETLNKSGRGTRRDKHWEPCVHRTVLLFPALLWGKPDRKENIQTSTGSRECAKPGAGKEGAPSTTPESVFIGKCVADYN